LVTCNAIPSRRHRATSSAADGRREHHDRRRLEAAIRLHAFGEVKAVGSRHLPVDNRQRERPVRAIGLLERVQRLVGVATTVGCIRQLNRTSSRIRRLVALSSTAEHRQRMQIGGLLARRVGSLAMEPRGEMKRAADADVAVEPHRAAHQRHEFRGNRQPEAGAAECPRGGGVGLREGVEDQRTFVGGDARCPYRRPAKWRTTASWSSDATSTLTTTSPWSVNLMAVADQIRQHLLQSARIADDLVGRVGADVARELQPLLLRAEGERLRSSSTVSRSGNATARARVCAPRSSKNPGCR
jgi:hypothetical protein